METLCAVRFEVDHLLTICRPCQLGGEMISTRLRPVIPCLGPRYGGQAWDPLERVLEENAPKAIHDSFEIQLRHGAVEHVVEEERQLWCDGARVH